MAAMESSGLEAARWSQEHGVDGRSLNAWRINLDRRGQAASDGPMRLRLVELVAHPTVAPSRYVVRMGEFAVEVDDGFDDATLRRLLGVVASC